MALLIWLGYSCELIGVGLLAWELWDRAHRLRRFETTVTGVFSGVLEGVEASVAGTVPRPAEQGVENRLDRLEQQLSNLRMQQQNAIRAAERRMSDAIEQRVSKAEAGVSARLGQLRDLVVGTTGGVSRAAAALAFLLLGLAGQLAAALVGM